MKFLKEMELQDEQRRAIMEVSPVYTLNPKP